MKWKRIYTKYQERIKWLEWYIREKKELEIICRTHTASRTIEDIKTMAGGFSEIIKEFVNGEEYLY
jgi:hypothetical protein